MFNELAPKPTFMLSTYRPGLALDLFDGSRRVPLFVLEASGGTTFKFTEDKTNLEDIQNMAPWVTAELLGAIKIAASVDELFEDL